MSKKFRVIRYIPKQIRDKSNEPHVESCDYSIEDISKQGFLASMIDGEHRIKVFQVI